VEFNEAARRLGLSPSRMDKLVSAGILPPPITALDKGGETYLEEEVDAMRTLLRWLLSKAKPE
jgi:hypothetical protein